MTTILRRCLQVPSCLLIALLAGCGGSSSPAAPSGSSAGSGTTPSPGAGGPTSSGGFAVSIDGAAFATSSVSAVCSTPGPSIVTIVGVSASGASSTSLGLTTLAQPGVHTIAAAQFTQGTLTVISGGSSSGFMAFQTLGRGTITITAISATAVAGSVDLVLVPTSGATTSRAITGTFSIPITGGGAACGPGGTLPGGTTGGGGTSGGGTATTGTFTATIDGGSFTGALGLTAVHANNQLSISGSDSQYTLQVIAGGVQGPGTYPISGSSPTTVVLALNGTAQVWLAGPTIGSGSITVTSLTSTTVAGTFSVTVGPSAGGPASGSKVIANGVFNVPLSTSTAVPPSVPAGPATPTGTPAGLVASIDGVLWRPAGPGQATRTAQGFVTIAGVDLQARGLSIAIFASAPGTYSLNNPNSHNALYSAASQQWFTSRPGGGGSVTIASISTTRVSGSFVMTLGPGPNNADQRTLQVTGTFDLSF